MKKNKYEVTLKNTSPLKQNKNLYLFLNKIHLIINTQTI